MQCDASQLELLRECGAMPASSRRCGLITAREAERLLGSLLEERRPRTTDRAFDVEHGCGLGAQGTFYAARYSSARAKCVRCRHCHAFLSPNKFVFHAHAAAANTLGKLE